MGYMGETPCRLASEWQPSIWSRCNRPPFPPTFSPKAFRSPPPEREMSFSMHSIYLTLAFSIDARGMV